MANARYSVRVSEDVPQRSPNQVPEGTTPGRSRNMSAIRRRDTKPELRLRSMLHQRGWRYRVDLRIDTARRRVRPDIVFTARRVAIFVDGCFWHGCPEHSRSPRKNVAYWGTKLAGNVARDQATTEALEESGWLVLRVWEHEPPESSTARIEVALHESRKER